MLSHCGGRIANLRDNVAQHILAHSKFLGPMSDFALLIEANSGTVGFTPILEIIGHRRLLDRASHFIEITLIQLIGCSIPSQAIGHPGADFRAAYAKSLHGSQPPQRSQLKRFQMQPSPTVHVFDARPYNPPSCQGTNVA
jgi:hypothetical protein